MPDKYINKYEIAALFGSSPKAAENELFKAGLRPIDLGPGRKRGKRWLESAVLDAMRRIHVKAQPGAIKPGKTAHSKKEIGLADMSLADIKKLVKKPDFTEPQPIQ